MRKLPLLVPAAAIALAAAAVIGPAWAQQRDYPLSSFSRVSSSAGVHVILKQGPYSVKAESANGSFDKLLLEVRGDTLVAGRKQDLFSWGGGPRYTVTVSAPDYAGFSASSGSSIDGENLSLKDLRVEVSSGANVDVTGSCAGLRVSVSSGADFDGGNLKCETASVDASSGADADAFATRSADGEASSGADITFHGRPASMTKDTSSGGSVKAL